MNYVLFGDENAVISLGKIELLCFILNDSTHIIEKNRLEKILGLEAKNKNLIWVLLSQLQSEITINKDFLTAFENPILFELKDETKKNKKLLGYSSSVFFELCKILTEVGKQNILADVHKKAYKNASAILNFFEEKDLKSEIEMATGFSFYKEKAKNELTQFFFKHKNDAAFEWVNTFTDSFFETVFLYLDTNWVEMRENPTKVADFIYTTIFMRIADKTFTAVQNQKPKRSYLSKSGVLLNREHPKLKNFNETIETFFKESLYNRVFFMEMLIKTYPKISTREVIDFKLDIENLKPTFFNQKLKKGLFEIIK